MTKCQAQHRVHDVTTSGVAAIAAAGTGCCSYQQLSTKTDRVSVCKRGLVSTPILIHGYGRGGIGTTVTVTVGGCC